MVYDARVVQAQVEARMAESRRQADEVFSFTLSDGSVTDSLTDVQADVMRQALGKEIDEDAEFVRRWATKRCLQAGRVANANFNAVVLAIGVRGEREIDAANIQRMVGLALSTVNSYLKMLVSQSDLKRIAAGQYKLRKEG